jgi:hypothetical protein
MSTQESYKAWIDKRCNTKSESSKLFTYTLGQYMISESNVSSDHSNHEITDVRDMNPSDNHHHDRIDEIISNDQTMSPTSEYEKSGICDQCVSPSQMQLPDNPKCNYPPCNFPPSRKNDDATWSRVRMVTFES